MKQIAFSIWALKQGLFLSFMIKSLDLCYSNTYSLIVILVIWKSQILGNSEIVVYIDSTIWYHFWVICSWSMSLCLDWLHSQSVASAEMLYENACLFDNSLNTIFSYLPKQRRTGLFSATQTHEVQDLIRAGLRNPVHVAVKERSMEGGSNVAEQKTPLTLNNLYLVCFVILVNCTLTL